MFVSHHPLGVHETNRRSSLACAVPRAGDRERRLRARSRARRQARERARNLRAFARRRPLGSRSGRGRPGPGRDRGGDRSCRRDGCARENPLAPTWPPVRDHRTDGGARSSARRARPPMIRYALTCDKGHTFESWFQSSAAYDKQIKAALITCPVCDSSKVEKTIMAPGVVGAKKRSDAQLPPASPPPAADAPSPVAMMAPPEREFRKKLKELRDHLTKNADY